MPSDLEKALARNRAALLARESEATFAIGNAYGNTRVRLLTRIDELAKLTAGRDYTSSEIARLDRAKTLLRQVEVEMTKLAASAQGPIVAGQQAVVGLAGTHAENLAVATASGSPSIAAEIGSTWNRLNTGATEAMVGRMSDGSPLRSWLGQFGSETGSLLGDALNDAVALGENPRAVAARLAKVTDISAARLLLMARTEQLGAYRDATLQNYQANEDILDGWIWTSAHQTRTCLSCLSLDGKLFPINTVFMASHPACRCSPRPSVKGVDDPAIQTGKQWFEALPETDQRQMIPVSAWRDFAAGKLTLDDFVYLDRNERWGDRYRQSSVATARDNARKRGQTFAAQPKLTPIRPAGGTASRIAASDTPSVRADVVSGSGSGFTIPKPPDDIVSSNHIQDVVSGAAPKVGARTSMSSPITSAEDFAISDYGDNGYKQINRALRDNLPGLLDRETTDLLDSTLNKSKTTEEMVVYRGMTGRPFGDLNASVGTVFTDKAYVSTSLNPAVSRGFASANADGVLVRIVLPKGSKAIDVESIHSGFNPEDEMLLPRGSSFRVVAARTGATPPEIDVEAIT